MGLGRHLPPGEEQSTRANAHTLTGSREYMHEHAVTQRGGGEGGEGGGEGVTVHKNTTRSHIRLHTHAHTHTHTRHAYTHILIHTQN